MRNPTDEELLPALYFVPTEVLRQPGYGDWLKRQLKAEEARGEGEGQSKEMLSIMGKAYGIFQDEIRSGAFCEDGQHPSRAALAAEAVVSAQGVREAIREGRAELATFCAYTLSRVLTQLGFWRRLDTSGQAEGGRIARQVVQERDDALFDTLFRACEDEKTPHGERKARIIDKWIDYEKKHLSKDKRRSYDAIRKAVEKRL